jgi:hypothetical protein
MTDTAPTTNAAARASDVLLRALGGSSVTLRMPAPATPGDPAEQRGLATPAFQDFPLAPAVYRKARATLADGQPAKSELLVSATAIEALVGSLDFSSASLLFASACGILADGDLLHIVSASSEQAGGQPYVYRLILRAPQSRIV